MTKKALQIPMTEKLLCGKMKIETAQRITHTKELA
jgi:hypothetical protein